MFSYLVSLPFSLSFFLSPRRCVCLSVILSLSFALSAAKVVDIIVSQPGFDYTNVRVDVCLRVSPAFVCSPSLTAVDVCELQVHSDASQDAIRDGFVAFDAQLRLTKEVKECGDSSGTTAVVVFVSPTHFVFANAGDSRAVLARADSVFETEDHKPGRVSCATLAATSSSALPATAVAVAVAVAASDAHRFTVAGE